MRKQFKAGEILVPRPNEVWAPINIPEVPATCGFFISTEGRVAKLHVAPNPYNQTIWVALFSIPIYRGNKQSPLVEFPLQDANGTSFRRRMTLLKLFVKTFLGENFLQAEVLANRKFLRDPDDISLKTLGGPNMQYLYRRYKILDAETWLINANGKYKIWPTVLGDASEPISGVHQKLLNRSAVFCDPAGKEYIDGCGLTWRPIIGNGVSEIDSYWISATGIVVQFPGVLDGPDDVSGVPVQPGVNCKLIQPCGKDLASVMLKNSSGDYVNRSIRRLVYNIFIDPTFKGRLGVLFEDGGIGGTHSLYEINTPIAEIKEKSFSKKPVLF